jgi:hypothetical protein
MLENGAADTDTLSTKYEVVKRLVFRFAFFIYKYWSYSKHRFKITLLHTVRYRIDLSLKQIQLNIHEKVYVNKKIRKCFKTAARQSACAYRF